MTIRIGVVWWVGCISLILVTILPSHTDLHQPWPSTPTPTTTDITYTKWTPHLFLVNLSHSSHVLSHTHTHTHTCTPLSKYSDGWNIDCKNQFYMIWLNQIWNSYAIWISQKATKVEQSKPSPKTCVTCYEKAPVTELTKPRNIQWYLLNHEQFQGQLN